MKYQIKQKVFSPALGLDPPFSGMITDYKNGVYYIFDQQRSKIWQRTEDQIKPI